MFGRLAAALTARGEWRVALAASLVFHLVGVLALAALFASSADEPKASVTIEVTIVGADAVEPPAAAGSETPQPRERPPSKPAKPPPSAAPAKASAAPPPIAAAPPPPPSEAVSIPLTISPPPPSASTAAMPDGAPQNQVTKEQIAAAGSPGASTATGTIATGATARSSAGEGADRPPRYRLGSASTPYPHYPMSARRNGQQGRVVIRIAVAADGHATAAEVVESSGHAVLDQSAVDTLKTWRLDPALAGGKPVPGQVNVPVRFRLSG